MERYSDRAIEIINDLHTERLDYDSEYTPLIDAANQLAAYENTGFTPEEMKNADRAMRAALELACEVQALRNQVKTELSQSRWISVKERLPEKSGWYAIYTEPVIFCVLPYSARHKAFNAFDENEDERNTFQLSDSAYWVALPDLPESVGGRKERENE